jgi:hypothetical protein
LLWVSPQSSIPSPSSVPRGEMVSPVGEAVQRKLPMVRTYLQSSVRWKLPKCDGASAVKEIPVDDVPASAKKVCLITMADQTGIDKYHAYLRSQVCYARRYNETVTHTIIDPSTFKRQNQAGEGEMKGQKGHVTNLKPYMINKALRSAPADGCAWVGWFDADVYFANQSIPLERWLEPAERAGAQVVLTDHTAGVVNAGGIFLRSSSWVRDVFMARWLSLMQLQAEGVKVPGNDNGFLVEALLRIFAEGYKGFGKDAPNAKRSCAEANDGTPFWRCARVQFECAFGFVREGRPVRGGGGLMLYNPKNGFNNHGCGPALAKSSVRSVCKQLYSQFLGYPWSPIDLFSPYPLGFGLHTKDISSLESEFDITQNCGPHDPKIMPPGSRPSPARRPVVSPKLNGSKAASHTPHVAHTSQGAAAGAPHARVHPASHGHAGVHAAHPPPGGVASHSHSRSSHSAPGSAHTNTGAPRISG